MRFLPEWWSQGVTGQDANGGFGTANMFQGPDASQLGNLSNLMPGEWDFMKKFKLGEMLGRMGGQGGFGRMGRMGMGRGQQMKREASMPNMNQVPSFTPYQAESMAPRMGQINSPLPTSPNGQIMPNWNRTYGGY